MITLSILSSSDWSLTQNTFSDLNGGMTGGGLIYSTGLLMAGSLAMILAAALFEFTGRDRVGQAGSAVFLGYSFSVCIMGVTLLDLGEWVMYLPPAIHVMIPICSLILSYSFYSRGMRREAVLGAITLISSVGVWVLGGPVNAIIQLLALIPFSVWQVAFGLHLYRLEYEEWD